MLSIVYPLPCYQDLAKDDDLEFMLCGDSKQVWGEEVVYCRTYMKEKKRNIVDPKLEKKRKRNKEKKNREKEKKKKKIVKKKKEEKKYMFRIKRKFRFGNGCFKCFMFGV